MSKSNNLSDFVTGLANKIRNCLGIETPLNPQNFEDLIDQVKQSGGLDTSAATALVTDVLEGKTFFSGDSTIKTGTIPSRGGATHYATTEAQTITEAGTYVSSEDTLSPISVSGLSAYNIKSGATITINNGQSNLFSVAGSYTGSPLIACTWQGNNTRLDQVTPSCWGCTRSGSSVLLPPGTYWLSGYNSANNDLSYMRLQTGSSTLVNCNRVSGTDWWANTSFTISSNTYCYMYNGGHSAYGVYTIFKIG